MAEQRRRHTNLFSHRRTWQHTWPITAAQTYLVEVICYLLVHFSCRAISCTRKKKEKKKTKRLKFTAYRWAIMTSLLYFLPQRLFSLAVFPSPLHTRARTHVHSQELNSTYNQNTTTCTLYAFQRGPTEQVRHACCKSIPRTINTTPWQLSGTVTWWRSLGHTFHSIGKYHRTNDMQWALVQTPMPFNHHRTSTMPSFGPSEGWRQQWENRPNIPNMRH